MNKLVISPKAIIQPTEIQLPSSKSESNRALIIAALAKNQSNLHNLSEARDTQTMLRLLKSDSETMDVLDAGTTMRFLTAYFSITGQKKIMTGTERMQERPIGILVDALKTLGAKISYLNNEGFPPLQIHPDFQQKTDKISIRGDVSSQYISALLMVAPVLPQGLTLELSGKIGSRPYIEMTLALMKEFGAEATWNGNTIHIKPQQYKEIAYTIESDWSGASYWFSFVALAELANVKLMGLRQDSLQGDIKITEIMEKLGVATQWKKDGVILTKQGSQSFLKQDFSDCPDLAQTVAVCCAAKGISAEFSGLESLRIKETDRIAAVQNELKKIGAKLEEKEEGIWLLTPPSAQLPKNIEVDTYDDHRMAMAFAPLATKMQVVIEDSSVVNKSYPSFWRHLTEAGFTLAPQ